MERHRLKPVEPPGISTHYMLGVLRSGLARVEILDGQSRGKRQAKRAGSVTLTPAGPVPRLICHESARLIVCAFSKPFIEDVAADLDHALPETDGNVTVRDTTIVRLSVLLDEEAASGGPGGMLYAESLARALALRFLSGLLPCLRQPRRGQTRYFTWPIRTISVSASGVIFA